jgi:CheY-like chemotaxis protein
MLMVEHILNLKFSDPHSQRLLDTLRASIQRASALVGQVVSFARGSETEQTTICPKHLLRDIEKLLVETFPRSIEIHVGDMAGLWGVKGDATQVYQVLMNLCVNARDAMPDGGLLTLAADNQQLTESAAAAHPEAKPGPYVCLTVADTGVGIAPQIRERIFDPFFTTKGQGQGTGLGLATVLRIVTAHGGWLEVKSEVGQGAQFKVYLPAAVASQEMHDEAEALALPVGHGEMILVVEDEAAIREVTRETLETYGYQVLTASDGAEAVALYAQHLASVQVVLLDLMLPLMDGRAIMRALRKLNPQCRIIATSGLLLNEQMTDATLTEVTQFLSKPFTAEKLLKTLATVLGH